MTDDGVKLRDEDASGSNSPVKRALLEMRRLRAESEALRQAHSAPVAIIGMALRLPGAIVSPEALWQALLEGGDLISEVPGERWEASLYRSPVPDQPGTMHSARGGFLQDVEVFDAEFFGIAPRDAASMDPQHRILLELAWEALERAGINPQSLFDTQTGIFLGLSNSDYSRLLVEHGEAIDAYTGVGAAISMAAGRPAYFFGCHGPAVVVDTACSSSLVAVHQAVSSLRRGETGLAMVGGANLILSPEMNLSFSRTGMLARDGRCKVFSEQADGYVRSEGCCMMVLKRLTDAERDGDKVLAVLHGTAVNQDGRSAGITAPNGPAQAAVLRAALKDAALEPLAVSYVEAHGTGTPLGDPMELQAIASVYGLGRTGGDRIKVGSVKSNLGHTEAAAGLVSLAKVVLMMQPGNGFVPNLHAGELNQRIDWGSLPIEIVGDVSPWERRNGQVYAGVSSFGFSGTNAHLIVGGPPETRREIGRAGEASAPSEHLLFFSATHVESLHRLARAYAEELSRSEVAFEDVCATALACRARLSKRVAVRASSSADASERLGRWLDGVFEASVLTNVGDDPTGYLPRSASANPTGQLQWDLVYGGAWAAIRPGRRVDLPLYPFRPTRFWFGLDAKTRLQQTRERAWQAMNRESSSESLRGPLGWNVEGYNRRWETLEKLTRLHAQHVLATSRAFAQPGEWASVAELVDHCGFRAIYANLVTRWLKSLAEAGVLEGSGDRFRATRAFEVPALDRIWAETAQAMADDPAALEYLQRCGAMLEDVVRGRKPALETLFPDGSFELARRLYEQSVEARYFNPIVAAAAAAAAKTIEGRRPIRILEIGAGTGATTSAILERARDARLEYWFTDVSEGFFHRAKQRFADRPGEHSARLQYALFDLERDPVEQGFPSGAFDLVVAANAVHAVRNLDTALQGIRKLLAPGGALILLETTHHHAWFDMSTGLIEGWQLFGDAYRQDQPLLNPDEWTAALAANGFDDVAAYPSASLPTAELGQHVLLARSSSAQAIAAAGVGGQEASASAVAEEKRGAEAKVPVAGSTFATREASSERMASPEEFALCVRQTICSVFRLDCSPEDLGDRDRLSDLGMDSLIALELRAELSRRLDLAAKIPSTIAFETGTVGELVRALKALRIYSEPADPAQRDGGSLPAGQPSTGATPLVTAIQLESMTDEEVEELLEQRLGRS